MITEVLSPEKEWIGSLGLTEEQSKHLMRVIGQVAKLTDYKYRKGAKKYGTFLMDLTAEELLDNAIDEAIDQVVYLLSLRDKLQCGKTS
jgi:hypothetical protein